MGLLLRPFFNFLITCVVFVFTIAIVLLLCRDICDCICLFVCLFVCVALIITFGRGILFYLLFSFFLYFCSSVATTSENQCDSFKVPLYL